MTKRFPVNYNNARWNQDNNNCLIYGSFPGNLKFRIYTKKL